MKIKLDENLPESLLQGLMALGHDVDNVRVEGLSGQPDPNVWQAAQQAGRFLITQDLDFSDKRRFAPGTHHGLMLVRLHRPGVWNWAGASWMFSAWKLLQPGSVVLSCLRITSCASMLHRVDASLTSVKNSTFGGAPTGGSSKTGICPQIKRRE